MVDFKDIRQFGAGQWDAFEELICQLAKRENLDGEYRRVEGAGGDGGVEAYWLHPNGSKTGYQAKYFLKSGSVDWAQIDKSVEKALSTHPELTTYVIAFACNLTDKRGIKGKTGWQQWEEHKKKWLSDASNRGINIEFIPWTETDILNKLILPSSLGLTKFWFGNEEFTHAKLAQRLDTAIKRLGERYHPEDHVKVSIQEVFPKLLRDKTVIKKINELRLPTLFKIPQIEGLKLETYPQLEKLVTGLEHELSNLFQISIDVPLSSFLPIHDLRECCERAQEKSREVRQWLWNKSDSYAESSDFPSELEEFNKKIYDLKDNIDALISYLYNRNNTLDSNRFLCITGIAGSGKSHTLAHFAEQAIVQGNPVLFFNGCDFYSGDVLEQIVQLSGASMPADDFFSLYDCAGETANARSLIIIDALNEGVGSTFWYTQLPKLFYQIQRYPHIACIVSFRKEYDDLILEKSLYDKLTQYQIYGFVTPEEQEEAARIYLDRRNIIRPSVPWLIPEFTNPLFLRSATTSLHKSGKREFPKGLRGISSLFSFFLEATSKNILPDNSLYSPLIKVLNVISHEILKTQKSLLPKTKVTQILSECFQGISAPNNDSWLEILIKNGILLNFPSREKDIDPLNPPEESIDFSFERLKDHLLAIKICGGVGNPQDAFKDGGIASFLCNLEKTRKWRGLHTALSIIIPEEFGIEYYDCLPDNVSSRIIASLRDGFVESIKWRKLDCYTQRTNELLDIFENNGLDVLALIIEVGISEGHPFNVTNFLSSRLFEMPMAQRDALWTNYINRNGDEDYDYLPIYKIISWVFDGAKRIENCKTNYYTAELLAWFFSSSHRELRDRATKALVQLMLIEPEVFSYIAQKFSNIDDLYILERIYAAAYGAINNFNNVDLKKKYALITYEHIFKNEKPPLNLKLRDYAKLIIEYACLNIAIENIDIKNITPPYNSEIPKLNLDKDSIERLVNNVGADRIYQSCTWDDFGRYEIDPHTRNFSMCLLSDGIPKTKKDLYEDFLEEITKRYGIEIANLISQVEKLKHSISINAFLRRFELKDKFEAGDVDESTITNKISLLESDLKEKLSKEDIDGYNAIAITYFESHKTDDIPKFHLEQFEFWIVKRSIEYGWSSQLFSNDDYSGYVSRERAKVERIGKKYQWLALSELQCRLADNYWLHEGYSDSKGKIYNSVHDIGFERDIDPTVLFPDLVNEETENSITKKLIWPSVEFENCTEEEVKQWSFLKCPADEIEEQIFRVQEDGREFVPLYEHVSDTERYAKGGEYKLHGLRRQQFHFYSCIVLKKPDLVKLIGAMEQSKKMDIHNWRPLELTDEGFILETEWKSFWEEEMWSNRFHEEDVDIKVAMPLVNYHWESHLDKTMPEGLKGYIPSLWLLKALGLKRNNGKLFTFKNGVGQSVFYNATSTDYSSGAYIEKEIFMKYLEENNLTCAWMYLTERNAWPGGDNKDASILCQKGIAWLEEEKIKKLIWNEDFGINS